MWHLVCNFIWKQRCDQGCRLVWCWNIYCAWNFLILLKFVSIQTPDLTIAFSNLIYRYSLFLLVRPVVMSSINKGLCVSSLSPTYPFCWCKCLPDRQSVNVENTKWKHMHQCCFKWYILQILIFHNVGGCLLTVLTGCILFISQCCWV